MAKLDAQQVDNYEYSASLYREQRAKITNKL